MGALKKAVPLPPRRGFGTPTPADHQADRSPHTGGWKWRQKSRKPNYLKRPSPKLICT